MKLSALTSQKKTGWSCLDYASESTAMKNLQHISFRKILVTM